PPPHLHSFPTRRSSDLSSSSTSSARDHRPWPGFHGFFFLGGGGARTFVGSGSAHGTRVSTARTSPDGSWCSPARITVTDDLTTLDRKSTRLNSSHVAIS